eukprot:10462815-Alexandrium_andersonii.AAC.1
MLRFGVPRLAFRRFSVLRFGDLACRHFAVVVSSLRAALQSRFGAPITCCVQHFECWNGRVSVCWRGALQCSRFRRAVRAALLHSALRVWAFRHAARWYSVST